MDGLYSREWMIKPSECNAEGCLPLTLLISQLIDLATDHANTLGIGFINLEPQGVGWVLSRLAIEMKKWPKNGEKYILSTWIESFNPHYSERCFSVESPDGEIFGYARTTWMVIDLQQHLSVGTAKLSIPENMILGVRCEVPRGKRYKSISPVTTSEYTFKYTDLDFYRHVNTVKYVALLMNQISLDMFDSYLLSRFDIAFAHEAKYGDTVIIKYFDEETKSPGILNTENLSLRRSFEIIKGENQILTASIYFTKIETA